MVIFYYFFTLLPFFLLQYPVLIWKISNNLPIYSFSSDENDPRKVIVKQLALVVPDRPDVTLDLTGDLSKLKKQVSV